MKKIIISLMISIIILIALFFIIQDHKNNKIQENVVVSNITENVNDKIQENCSRRCMNKVHRDP